MLGQQLAKLSPGEETLHEGGTGHIVGKRHVWLPGSHTVLRSAAALEATSGLRPDVQSPRGPPPQVACATALVQWSYALALRSLCLSLR